VIRQTALSAAANSTVIEKRSAITHQQFVGSRWEPHSSDPFAAIFKLKQLCRSTGSAHPSSFSPA